MTYSDSLVRLKIDEAFPEGRGEGEGGAAAGKAPFTRSRVTRLAEKC